MRRMLCSMMVALGGAALLQPPRAHAFGEPETITLTIVEGYDQDQEKLLSQMGELQRWQFSDDTYGEVETESWVSLDFSPLDLTGDPEVVAVRACVEYFVDFDFGSGNLMWRARAGFLQNPQPIPGVSFQDSRFFPNPLFVGEGAEGTACWEFNGTLLNVLRANPFLINALVMVIHNLDDDEVVVVDVVTVEVDVAPSDVCADAQFCDDDNECTLDFCVPETGCVHQPINCDDGNACTADGCSSILGCVHAPVNCTDDNACTADACDPASGCTHDALSCDDGDACTLDGCDPVEGCSHSPLQCDDGDPCTPDGCDSVDGCFSLPPDCSDGDPCNGLEICDPQVGCVEGPINDCNDNGVDDACDLPRHDCNANGIPDDCDIAAGTSGDDDGDGIPDECEADCPADLNGDGTVNGADLAVMLGQWGQQGALSGDLNGDGTVNGADLAIMLGAWGPCAAQDGACCNFDGLGGCAQVTADACAFAGGTFLGEEISCDACPPPTCGPGSGDCCVPNGTAGCEDSACCAEVCTIDSFCCEVEWDFICAGDAADLCLGCIPPPPNDDCEDAVLIGDGGTPFDNTGATTDGPAHPACKFDGQTVNDVWFDYVASCSGTLTVTTCNQADFDTDVVVYDGCGCPVSDAELLGCNDDTPGCDQFTSRVMVSVVQDNCYKIRIGAFSVLEFGSGTVTLICNAP